MNSRRALTIVASAGLALALLAAPASGLMPNPRPRPIPVPLPEPVPPWPGNGWVWVPPTYQTVHERIWQEGHFEITYERAWVPETAGWRTVRYWDGGQWVERQEWVVITPGYWSSTPRQVWVPGRWTTQARTIQVTQGRWEWRGPGNPPPVVQPPIVQPPTGRPPELEPFSPLWEWPADSKKK
ncbi:MAG: hypothetical protein ACAI43_26815 [Phycisphaerae bacterium]|nr:hypothetical protein [Tepidisphaeraceae bacterium]